MPLAGFWTGPLAGISPEEGKMRRMVFMSIVLATAVSIGGCDRNRRNAANNPGTGAGAVGTSGENDRNKVSSKDKDFVHDLAIANMAEVDLGRLAVEKSANTEVKKFGQMMIDDHTKAGASLRMVASKYNIPAPSDLDDKHRRTHDKLAKLQGADFDREYMEAMVDGHEDVLDKLSSRVDQATLSEWRAEQVDRLSGKKVEAQAKAIAILPEKSDNEVTMAVNEWAADAYPIVFAHLEAAKVLREAVKKRLTH
jgi:putative membrane protein